MTLSDIAAGVEVTTHQRDRGVAAVDETDASLPERLAPVADDLPCLAATAATVVEAYAAGKSVGDAGRAAGVAPVMAAKTLHLVGEQVSPVGPQGREIIADWLAGDLSRTDAIALAGVTEREFALAVYIETHEPLPAARDAVEGALTTADRDPLGETMSDVGELL
jgi:4'-phosphopantetheinyl transferase EntD